MTKTEAMEALGVDKYQKLAEVLSVSPAAVSQWPEDLPPHAVRRVESVLYRRIPRRLRSQGR